MQWLIDIIVGICKTYTDEQIALQAHVPTGTICAWHGLWGNIPTGWHACDGTTGTPDLRDRMIICGGGIEPIAATGGSKTATLPGGTDLASGKTFSRTHDNMPPYAVYWWIMKL